MNVQNIKPKTVYQATAGIAGFGLVVILLAAIFSGQGKATLTGHVSFQGKPIIWGSVVVVGQDGRTAAGRIEADGTFRVENAATGSVSVAVVSRDPLVQNWASNLKTTRARPTSKAFSASPVDRKKWFPLPTHFEDPQASGVTMLLKSGDNEKDLNLN